MTDRVGMGLGALCAGLVALGVGACEPRGGVSVPIEASPSDNGADPVVVRVSGTAIHQSEVERAAAARGSVADGTQLSPTDPAFTAALEELVDQRLFALDAQARGLDREPEAQRRLRAAGERLLGNYNVEQRVTQAVTETTLRELYDAQNALAGHEPERELRRMAFADGTTARAALLRVTDEESFEAIAEDLGSEVDSGPAWFGRDDLPDALADAVFAAEIGTRLPTIEADGQWHIVEVLDRRTPGAQAFEDVRDDLERFITLRTVDDALSQLREAATIDYVGREPVTDAGDAAPAASSDAPQ